MLKSAQIAHTLSAATWHSHALLWAEVGAGCLWQGHRHWGCRVHAWLQASIAVVPLGLQREKPKGLWEADESHQPSPAGGAWGHFAASPAR